jgi:glycosyltransferase involved in cell wall biosynthesis
MKVLYLFHRYLPEFAGGGEISNHILVTESMKRNDVVVASLSVSPRSMPREHEGVVVHRFHRPPLEKMPIGGFDKLNAKAAEMMAAGRVQRFIESERPDIIHTSSSMVLPIMARVRRKMGIPYVCHIRAYWFKSLDAKAIEEGRIDETDDALCSRAQCGTGRMRGPLYYLYFKGVREALGNADRIIAISDWMKGVVEGEGYSGVTRVYNPVDLGLKPRFDPVGKEKRFFFAGSLTPMKGVPELLRAFAKVHRRDPEWNLRIAGMGKLDERSARAPGVDYIGEVSYERVLREMRDSRVCVFPTKMPEPFGRVIAEAQSVGSLVVGADTGAMPELLAHGGFTAPVEPEALARAMWKASRVDGEGYVKRVKAAYRFVSRNCSRERMMEQVQGIYDEVLGSR